MCLVNYSVLLIYVLSTASRCLSVLPYIADGLEFGCRMLMVLLMACCVISQCLHPYFVCYSILVSRWEFPWILAFLSHVACMCAHLLLISNAAYSTYILDADRLRHVQLGSCAVACICLVSWEVCM